MAEKVDNRKTPDWRRAVDMTPNGDQPLTTFGSLHSTNFRYLLTGTVFTNASLWIQSVTVSWLVSSLKGIALLDGFGTIVFPLITCRFEVKKALTTGAIFNRTNKI